jgi:hypothetical protein
MTEQEIIDKYTEPPTPAYINWWEISCHKGLSDDFIRKYADRVNWAYISYYQTLSEDFIREFKDRVDWEGISKKQTLSDDFLEEFEDKIVWKEIWNLGNEHLLSSEFKKRFKGHKPQSRW